MLLKFSLLLQAESRVGGGYTVPYDSTQGVPGIVFLLFWVIIILFFIRLGWEYRDKLFPKKIPGKPKPTKPKINKTK